MNFLNKYEKQIIELLIQNDRSLSEISKVIGISKPATSKLLKKLEEQKLIKGEYEINSIGRTIRYSLQPFQLLFSIDPQNKFIISFKADEPIDTNYLYLGNIKQIEFRNDIREYLAKITKSHINRYLIILYGSVAQGIGTRKSDIDLLLLKNEWSKKERDKILNLLASASDKCNFQVKPVFKNTKEFEKNDKLLQKEIIKHGIVLFEKGSQWESIKEKMNRYKTITI